MVTDWGADNDHALGVKNGSNLVMPAPGPDAAIGLVNAVKEGRVSEADLDERLKELFRVLVSADEVMKKAPKSFDKDAHHALARKCAEQSIVLLENDGILPLDRNAVVGIIGDFARNPRYQGAGSSMVNPTRLDNLYDCLRAAGVSIAGYAQGFDRRKPNPDRKLIDEAVRVAEAAPVVLLCVGLDEIAESEGMDRSNMELSKGQRELIEAVCKVNRNVVLVLSGGSPFVIPGSFRAAIHGYLGGQAGAGAMADALLGKVNPSGKLNETWPLQLEDTPACAYFPSKERTAEYREGLYIGYRYYDTANVPVRYPFGHGLSYTTFLYSDIHAEKDRVTFTIANAGAWDGAEVAQVYVSCRDGNVFRPQKELKGFAKVFLKAGESRTVSVSLDDKAFRYFNVKTNRWEVESGIYTISVASDAAHVRLSANIRVEGTNAPAPYGALPGYESGRITRISEEEYRDLLGHPIPDGHWGGELTRNDAICQLYYAKTGAARLVYKILTHMKEKSEAKGIPDLNILFVYNMPFRALAKMSGGLMSDRMVDDVVLLVNGHFWRGLGRLIGDFFRNRRANKAFMRKIR